MSAAQRRANLGLRKSGSGKVAEPLAAQSPADGVHGAEVGKLAYGDQSIPEEIRDAFGVSNKAFKQTIGVRYREWRITIEPYRFSLVRIL